MYKLLLALLASFLTLGADPPDDDPDPAGDPPEGDPPEDDLPDLGGDEDEPDPPAGDPPDEPPAVKSLRERAEKAEREAREASERLAAADRARQPSQPSDEQKLLAQEDAILADPKCTEQQRYWVQANRTLRENTRTSRQALMESREIADKAEWDRLKGSTPVLKKYEDRVEKKLQDIRSTGQNLSRKLVAQLLIGEDIVGGKVKSTKRAAPGDTGKGNTVDRGKPPSGRSDVGRRGGGQSDHEKRAARLANVHI